MGDQVKLDPVIPLVVCIQTFDTVAAIAGGLAEALFGIPDDIGQQGWSYLPEDMQRVIRDLYRMAGEPLPGGPTLQGSVSPNRNSWE